MSNQVAREPNDLARLFVDRANAGNLDGIVALFEPDAVVSSPDGQDLVGHEAIHAKYAAVLARRPRFSLGNQQQAMIHGDIALTSTWFDDSGAAAEVAHRQLDGTWLWLIDKGRINA
jgi:ketosteroid isomerase-like protein